MHLVSRLSEVGLNAFSFSVEEWGRNSGWGAWDNRWIKDLQELRVCFLWQGIFSNDFNMFCLWKKSIPIFCLACFIVCRKNYIYLSLYVSVCKVKNTALSINCLAYDFLRFYTHTHTHTHTHIYIYIYIKRDRERDWERERERERPSCRVCSTFVETK